MKVDYNMHGCGVRMDKKTANEQNTGWNEWPRKYINDKQAKRVIEELNGVNNKQTKAIPDYKECTLYPGYFTECKTG